MDSEFSLEGETIPIAEQEQEPGRRGFLNPETLARAQETRTTNRRNMEPQSLDGTEIVGDTEPKKRGRKPGTPNKKPRDLAGVEAILVGVHAMLAIRTNCPEMVIDEKEGHQLAEAIANVADHYKIKLDGKTGAIAGFVYALGIVYGPRAIAIALRVRNERKNPGKATEQNGHTFTE